MRLVWIIASLAAFGCGVPKTVHGEDTSSVQPLPIGTWEVVRVFIDLSAGMGRDSLPDDPSLVGRTLVIGPHDLTFSPHRDWNHCRQKRWAGYSMTWRKVFAGGLGAHDNREATTELYEFPGRADAKVTIFPVCEAEIPRKGLLAGTWIAMDSPDRLAMRETPQTLLLFKRRQSDAPIAASFPCERARTNVEKAICSDRDLAALDRSVAAAFELTRDVWPDRRAALCSQKHWLVDRDKCGSDVSCLKETLFTRAVELVEVVKFSGGSDSYFEDCGKRADAETGARALPQR